MFHVVLYQPEIPPNTGNIMRLCANTGASLHLIHPLGFQLTEKALRRAGMDYRDFANVQEHNSYSAFLQTAQPKRCLPCSTKGRSSYTEINYRSDDFLIFGPETRGLPQDVIDRLGVHRCVRIPMRSDSRSLNLSNATAIVLYEGLRQQDFPGNA